MCAILQPVLLALGLFGPKSRELAQSLTRDDLSNEALGYFKLKHTYLGHVPVMLARSYRMWVSWDMKFILPLTWHLNSGIPFGRLEKNIGLIAAGRGAFNSMRLGKRIPQLRYGYDERAQSLRSGTWFFRSQGRRVYGR